jgi:hypothetical protein
VGKKMLWFERIGARRVGRMELKPKSMELFDVVDGLVD